MTKIAEARARKLASKHGWKVYGGKLKHLLNTRQVKHNKKEMLRRCIWLDSSVVLYLFVCVCIRKRFRSPLSTVWSLSTATLRKHSVHHAEPSKASCAPIPQGATSLWLQLHDLNWSKSKAFSDGFLQAGHGKCLHDSLCRLCLYHNFLAKHDPFSCFLCWLVLGLDHA